jgi:hypothetical protein
VIVASLVGCVGAGSAGSRPLARQTQATATQAVAEWERLVGRQYENKGIARIERLGDRWVLAVWCRGIHTTYLDDTDLDLARHQDRFVSVRYEYVDRIVQNPKCVRAPCPAVTERRIRLDRITAIEITREQADERARQCK